MFNSISKLTAKFGLTTKFIPPIIAAVLVSMIIGALFMINEAQRANEVQLTIAESAFKAEQEHANDALNKALKSKADSIGRFMSKTAVDFILSYDFTALTQFQAEASKDTDVAFAAYLKPDESAMAAFDKPESAHKILEFKYPIVNEGDTIGYVLLGMTTKSINEGTARAQKRIDAAIMSAKDSSADSMTRFMTIISIDMIAIVAIVTLVIYFLFQINIVRPLRQTRTLIKGLAEGEGDLTVHLPVHNKDEINTLHVHINAFIESLHAMIESIVAEVKRLDDESAILQGHSNEMSTNADRLNDNTTQVATAMNEMSATVQEVARSSAEAATAAENGREEANQGKDVVKTAINGIASLSSEVENAADVITKLAENSERISTVLDVINGIAEQTNLLALNAAIEAARAGEQGRGFAVVADEVRTLASRTHESTLEIREMIDMVQSSTQDAVKAMSQGQDAAKASVEQAKAVGTTLQSIIDKVTVISDMSTQIASAAEQQSSTTEEINKNIVTINEISGNTSVTSSETNQSSSEITDMASRLNNLVSKFKI